MSFADPLSITIDGVTSALPQVETGETESTYRNGDGTVAVSGAHSGSKGRSRHVLRVDTEKVSPDPFRPDENVRRSMSVYIVFDVPEDGFTNSEVLAVFTGFNTLMTTSSNAIIGKLLGGEH